MADEQTMEVHCLVWTGAGRIHDNGNYTDLERAEKHAKHANEGLSWFYRLYGNRWRVRTLEVKIGKKQ